MTGKEAKILFIKFSEEAFDKLGFKLLKNRDNETIYLRALENGNEEIGISPNDYRPVQVFGFGTSKRINIIEDVVLGMCNEITLTDNETIVKEILAKKAQTLCYRRDIELCKLQLSEVAELSDELAVQKASEIILRYMTEKALPAYESFNDIRVLDAIINGEGENFWDDAFGRSKPFNLAHLFYPRRVTIARLCKTDAEFEQFVASIYADIDIRLASQGKAQLNRNDESIFINRLMQYMRKNVVPM